MGIRSSSSAAMLLLMAAAIGAAPLVAQTPAQDPSARLRAVLPADVATRVLDRVAQARDRQLPAAALENRALELAAKRVTPAQLEAGVNSYADQLQHGRSALMHGGRATPTDTETEAAAAAIQQGVDGASVSALAKSAPSGRSLAVPLYVMSSLVSRGLPSDQALAQVQARLAARATDAELMHATGKPVEAPGKPAVTGQESGASHRPASTPARPSTVPANPGSGARPATVPVTPPSHPGGKP